MVSEENEATLLYLELIAQPKQDDNINPQLSMRLDHQQGTTLHNFHFTTIHKNASLFSSD